MGADEGMSGQADENQRARVRGISGGVDEHQPSIVGQMSIS